MPSGLLSCTFRSCSAVSDCGRPTDQAIICTFKLKRLFADLWQNVQQINSFRAKRQTGCVYPDPAGATYPFTNNFWIRPYRLTLLYIIVLRIRLNLFYLNVSFSGSSVYSLISRKIKLLQNRYYEWKHENNGTAVYWCQILYINIQQMAAPYHQCHV